MQRGAQSARRQFGGWLSRLMFSNTFSRNRVPMQRGEVMFFRSGALVLYFPVCGAHLWEAKMDHAETKSVPMQRGARFPFSGSVPMQRGDRFRIFDVPLGGPTWPQRGRPKYL